MPSVFRLLAVLSITALAVLPARAEVHELVFGVTRAREDFHPVGPTLATLADGSWSPAGISPTGSADQGRAQGLFGSFDGGVLRLAWSQRTHGMGSGIDVRLAMFNAAGRRLSGPGSLPLSTAPGDQQLYGFVFDVRSGRGLLIWLSRSYESPFDTDAHGALYIEESRER